MKIKLIGAVAGGFIFGVAVGTILMKEKYRKESEAAIETIRDYYSPRGTDSVLTPLNGWC